MKMLKRMVGFLFCLMMLPSMAHAQYQHASFFNGGTSLTATCTKTTGALTSSDSFLGTLQGNTTVTLPAASIGCVDYDVIDLRATQGTNQSYSLTVNAGSGTTKVVPSNGGSALSVPTSTGSSTGTVLHQIWVYNVVAGTPQWELVTQETLPAQAAPATAGANSNITSLTGLTTALPVLGGGTGTTTSTGNGSVVLSNSPALSGTLTAGAISTAGTITAPSISGLSTPLSVVQGGNGTASPSLVAGTNTTVTGTWPAQAVNAVSSATLVGGTWDAQPLPGATLTASVTSGSTAFTLTGGTCRVGEYISVRGASANVVPTIGCNGMASLPYGGGTIYAPVTTTIFSCSSGTVGVANVTFSQTLSAAPTRIGADVSAAINSTCQGIACALPPNGQGFLANAISLHTSNTTVYGQNTVLLTGFINNATTCSNAQDGIDIGVAGCNGGTCSHSNRVSNVVISDVLLDLGGYTNMNGVYGHDNGIAIAYGSRIVLQHDTVSNSTNFGELAYEDFDDVVFLDDTVLDAWSDAFHFDGSWTVGSGDTTTNGWIVNGYVNGYYDTGMAAIGGSLSPMTGIHFDHPTIIAMAGTGGGTGLQFGGNVQNSEATGAITELSGRVGLLINDWYGYAPKHIKIVGGSFDYGESVQVGYASNSIGIQSHAGNSACLAGTGNPWVPCTGVGTGTASTTGQIWDITLDGVTMNASAGAASMTPIPAASGGYNYCDSCGVLIDDNVSDVHFFNPVIAVTGTVTSFWGFVDNNDTAAGYGVTADRKNITVDNPILDVTNATAGSNGWITTGMFWQATPSKYPSDTWFYSHPQILGTSSTLPVICPISTGGTPWTENQCTGACAGQSTLSGGTVTVTSACFRGSTDVVSCTDTTAAAAVKCVASSGSLAITGTSSDVISWNKIQ